MTRHHSLSITFIWIMSRYSFGRNKPNEQKEKNVFIGEPRPKNVNDKIQAREVMMEKTLDGEESLKITVKASRPGGARKFLARHESACCPGTTGQSGRLNRSDKRPALNFQV